MFNNLLYNKWLFFSLFHELFSWNKCLLKTMEYYPKLIWYHTQYKTAITILLKPNGRGLYHGSSFRFFSSLFLIIFLCSSIRLTQLILLQRRFFGPRYIGDDFFLGPRYIGDDFYFRADRSLGAKQEGLTIVHF
jgi:hypothetical protein